jgi:hypothetical protein
MSDRPSRLWKQLPPETRLEAAAAFWADDQEEAAMQQVEAVVVIARRLNFRPKTVQALPADRRSRQLAQIPEVSDAIASRALIAYHFAARRDLMSAFLDALGIAHDRGLIAQETLTSPDGAQLAAAVSSLRSAFPAADVDLYLRTLTTLDGDTWSGLNGLLADAR